MASLYISVILLCRVIQAFFSKRSSNEINGISTLVGYTAFQNTISAILGLIIIGIAGNGFKAELLTVIIACFSGLTLFFSAACSIYGMKSGTVSVNSMFGTAGMLIPLIAGVFFFGNPISHIQWLGVGIFFVSAFLLVQGSKSVYSNFSLKTLILLIGSLAGNGVTMLAQQLFTYYVPDGDVSVFSFISFGIIAVLGSLFYIFIKQRTKLSVKSDGVKCKESIICQNKSPKTLTVCGLFLASAVFVINQLATLSTALVSPVILFTFINGGGTIISTVVSAIVYKERLYPKTILGVLLGISSLVIIKLF